jgi:hypothetical protein
MTEIVDDNIGRFLSHCDWFCQVGEQPVPNAMDSDPINRFHRGSSAIPTTQDCDFIPESGESTGNFGCGPLHPPRQWITNVPVSQPKDLHPVGFGWSALSPRELMLGGDGRSRTRSMSSVVASLAIRQFRLHGK